MIVVDLHESSSVTSSSKARGSLTIWGCDEETLHSLREGAAFRVQHLTTSSRFGRLRLSTSRRRSVWTPIHFVGDGSSARSSGSLPKTALTTNRACPNFRPRSIFDFERSAAVGVSPSDRSQRGSMTAVDSAAGLWPIDCVAVVLRVCHSPSMTRAARFGGGAEQHSAKVFLIVPSLGTPTWNTESSGVNDSTSVGRSAEKFQVLVMELWCTEAEQASAAAAAAGGGGGSGGCGGSSSGGGGGRGGVPVSPLPSSALSLSSSSSSSLRASGMAAKRLLLRPLSGPVALQNIEYVKYDPNLGVHALNWSPDTSKAVPAARVAAATGDQHPLSYLHPAMEKLKAWYSNSASFDRDIRAARQLVEGIVDH